MLHVMDLQVTYMGSILVGVRIGLASPRCDDPSKEADEPKFPDVRRINTSSIAETPALSLRNPPTKVAIRFSFFL
jgi:hypothetical protein